MDCVPVRTADMRRAKNEALTILKDFEILEPPVNPVEIAEELGVTVQFAKFKPGSNISGFYDCRKGIIYVNSEEQPKRQTFTIAHELGHHILHREWAATENYVALLRQGSGSAEPHEREANEFAGHLLMPKFMIDSYRSMLSKKQMSDLFVTSMAALEVRLSKEYG